MGGLRNRLDRVQRRLGPPAPVAVSIWWEYQEHSGHLSPCPLELAPREVETLEREHVCVPEAELADAIRLTWDDRENDHKRGGPSWRSAHGPRRST